MQSAVRGRCGPCRRDMKHDARRRGLHCRGPGAGWWPPPPKDSHDRAAPACHRSGGRPDARAGGGWRGADRRSQCPGAGAAGRGHRRAAVVLGAASPRLPVGAGRGSGGVAEARGADAAVVPRRRAEPDRPCLGDDAGIGAGGSCRLRGSDPAGTGRIHPPRLRGQRQPRTAHAADRPCRLHRDAEGPGAQRRGGARTLPGDHGARGGADDPAGQRPSVAEPRRVRGAPPPLGRGGTDGDRAVGAGAASTPATPRRSGRSPRARSAGRSSSARRPAT